MIFGARLSRFGLSALAGAIAIFASLPSPQVARAAGGADMVVEKQASASEVPVDGQFTYTITARNVGTATANGVRVRDTRIDKELIVTSGPTTTGGLICRIDAENNLLCRLRHLAPGAEVSVSFTVRAPEAACVLIRNRSTTAARNEPAANTTNNTSAFVSVRMTGCPPDTTPPTGSVRINRGQPIAWGPNVLLSLGVTDDRTGDKSILMRLSNAFSAGRMVNPLNQGYVPSRRWSLTNPDRGGTSATGEKSVYARFRDRAGNWSAVVNDTILMRADAPRSCSVAAARARRPLDRTLHETVYPRTDIDWFKFRLTSRRDVTISLGQLPANFDLALAGGGCGVIARSERLGTQRDIIARTLGPGLYFVRVEGARDVIESVRPYAVRFDTQP